jgi:hypothetical protein
MSLRKERLFNVKSFFGGSVIIFSQAIRACIVSESNPDMEHRPPRQIISYWRLYWQAGLLDGGGIVIISVFWK